MNVADIAIILIIATSIVVGVVRGFIAEAMALAVWAAAIALSMMFGGALASLFETSIELPSARLALGHALIFIGTLVLGAVLTYLLRKLVESTGLSGTDRLLGMGFGLVRGGLLVVALVILLGWTPLPRDPWWQESRAIPTFQRVAEQLSRMLPDSVRRYLDYGAGAAAPNTPAVPPPAAPTAKT